MLHCAEGKIGGFLVGALGLGTRNLRPRAMTASTGRILKGIFILSRDGTEEIASFGVCLRTGYEWESGSSKRLLFFYRLGINNLGSGQLAIYAKKQVQSTCIGKHMHDPGPKLVMRRTAKLSTDVAAQQLPTERGPKGL